MSTALISLASDKANDSLGDKAESILRVNDPNLVRETLQADLTRLKGVLLAALADPRFDVMIIVGDLPWYGQEALVAQINSTLERRLDGLQHMIRSVLTEMVGADALFSWSCAGAVRDRFVMALPGPVSQIELVLERLVIPQWPRLLEWAKG